jgi:hypothetical protein
MLLTLTDKLWATHYPRNATKADYKPVLSNVLSILLCSERGGPYRVSGIAGQPLTKGFCCGAGKPRPNSDGRLLCRRTPSLSRVRRRLLLCLHQRSLSLGRLECQLHHLRTEVLSIVLM